jgi:hypothetical protein
LRSFGPISALSLALVTLSVPVLVALLPYLTSNSFANGKKTPAEPVETNPRPTPVSRKGVDRGIGGTGLNDDRGIGGTGFVGSITKFGSIFVNGAEIFYDPRQNIRVDGQAQPSSAIKIGYVAHVIATGSNGHGFTATQIAIDHEVLGPISAIGDKTELTVLGQKVDVSTIDGSESLKVGDWVAVSGLRRADDTIAATLVETIAPTTAQIVGRITRSANGRRMIGQMPLLGPVALKFLNERVIVRGQPAGTSLRLRHIAKADLLAASRNIHRISIEGYFRKVDEKIVLPADPEVRLIGKPGSGLIDAAGPGTALPDGNGPAIVDGTVEPNGTISITHIRAPNTRLEGRGGPDISPQSPGGPNNATGDPNSSSSGRSSRTGESDDGSRTGTGTGGESDDDGATTGTGTGTGSGTGSGTGTGTSGSGGHGGSHGSGGSRGKD